MTVRCTQICLQVPAAGAVELEVTYAVSGASWASSYDVRAFPGQPHTVMCYCYGEVRQVSRTHLVHTYLSADDASVCYEASYYSDDLL
jgi:hypothetical protein